MRVWTSKRIATSCTSSTTESDSEMPQISVPGKISRSPCRSARACAVHVIQDGILRGLPSKRVDKYIDVPMCRSFLEYSPDKSIMNISESVRNGSNRSFFFLRVF
uniref:Uncharacterized protein n=1 Tax=Sipha flava TaxID=143950 RepID=A0A2S2QUI7_9HEMI